MADEAEGKDELWFINKTVELFNKLEDRTINNEEVTLLAYLPNRSEKGGSLYSESLRSPIRGPPAATSTFFVRLRRVEKYREMVSFENF